MKYVESLDEIRPVIIITVYNRLQHIRQCLESLEECIGVEDYTVIVGSDAPANESHACSIRELRSFLCTKKKYNKFSEIHVINHEDNVGQLKNLISCHSLARSLGFKTFVYMEDDIVVGKHYLRYVHDGLFKYCQEPDVIAINGYLAPGHSAGMSECFLFNEFCAYGYASWFEKWDRVLESKSKTNYAYRVVSDPVMLRKYARISPNAKSLPFLAEDLYRAGDIELGLMLDVEGLWVLRPPFSLTANRGLDGSGLRSGVNPALQRMQPYDGNVQVPEPKDAARIKLENIQDGIGIKRKFINCLVLAVYKYIPRGFGLLIHLRNLKKSL